MCTVKQKLRESWIWFDQTFLGLGLGKIFPARESLVSDIPAGNGNIVKLFLQCALYINMCHRGLKSLDFSEFETQNAKPYKIIRIASTASEA